MRLSSSAVRQCSCPLWSRLSGCVLFSEKRGNGSLKFARHIRRYGFHVYVGHVLSIGTYNMDVVMISALANSRSVGFYSLAGSVAAAGLPVVGMSSALFASVARAPRIRRHWVLLAIVIGTLTALLAWVLAEPFIRLAFSSRYAPAGALVLPLALAQAVRGHGCLQHLSVLARARPTTQKHKFRPDGKQPHLKLRSDPALRRGRSCLGKSGGASSELDRLRTVLSTVAPRVPLTGPMRLK